MNVKKKGPFGLRFEQLMILLFVSLIIIWVFIIQPVLAWMEANPVTTTFLILTLVGVGGYGGYRYILYKNQHDLNEVELKKREIAVLHKDELEKSNYTEQEKQLRIDMWYREAIEKGTQGKEKKERIPVPVDTKKSVYERANYKCQSCGVTVNLHIHHIDKDPSNNSLSNLVLLCPTDHALADKGNWRAEQLRALRDKAWTKSPGRVA